MERIREIEMEHKIRTFEAEIEYYTTIICVLRSTVHGLRDLKREG